MRYSITAKLFSLCILLVIFSSLFISIPAVVLLKKDKQEASQLRIQVAFDIIKDDYTNRINNQKLQVEEFLQQISAFSWGLSWYEKTNPKQEFFSNSTYSSYIITIGEELVRFSRLMAADRIAVYGTDKRLLVSFNRESDKHNAYAYITSNDGKDIYLTIDVYSQYLIRKRIVASPASLNNDETHLLYEIPFDMRNEHFAEDNKLGMRLVVPIFHQSKSVGALVVESFYSQELVERYASLSQTLISIFAGNRLSIGTLLLQNELVLKNIDSYSSKTAQAVSIAGKDYYQGILSLTDSNGAPVGAITSSLSQAIEIAEVRKIWLGVMALSFLAIIMSLILAILFSRNTIRFIKDLTETTSAFAGGNLERNIQIQGNDELGSLAKSFSTMRDSIRQQISDLNHEILERKQTEEILRKREKEKAALEDQLVQAQKMEAIGTLAGGIAHDFNNLLTVILGYSELMKRSLSEDSKFLKSVEQIVTAGDRAKCLVAQILAFSRQSNTEFLPIKPDEIINEALEMLRASIPATIEIRQDVKKCGYIIADSTQFHQVVLNLCTNAYHAMRETGGVLSVSLQKVTLAMDEAYQLSSQLLPGTYLKLSISDTGHGMDKETQLKIFEPYFTTKPQGEGTGLGLAVVHGVVKSFGGCIIVSSEKYKGTTFDIYIPEAEFFSDQSTSINHEVLPSGEEHLLLVDDEKAIVELLKTILEELGYQITTSTSPLDAIAIFSENPEDFSLVITDMTMPGMTGVELLWKLKQIKPEIKIILCTGYSDLINEEKVHGMDIENYLIKPITQKDLATAVRNALDSSMDE